MRVKSHIILIVLTLLAAGLFGALAQPQGGLPAVDGHDLVAFLNQTVEWYRHLAVEQQLASQPSDLSFVEDDRRLAEQILRLSFEYAKAQEPLLEADSPQGVQPSSSYKALLDAVIKADKQIKTSQAAIEALRQKLEIAEGAKRRALQLAIAENQSELELAQTRRDVLRTMVGFIGKAGSSGPGDVKSQIDELERVLPAANTNGERTAVATPSAMPPARPEPAGIIALINDLRALNRKKAALDETIRLTQDVADKARALRAPQTAELKRLAGEGDALTNEPDSDDPGVLAQQKEALDQVTSQFKQLAAIILPLGKQRILLDLYKSNLANWRSSVQAQYTSELRSLALRLGLLVIVLAAVIGVSELWRRAILRYVPDARRRHQFLLLRRIVVYFLIAIIIAFAFATELGSLATFAGLLTAGIAVALQNVILSVAGYFFLIGKHGVRVGDRVQVQGVTGEVIDIGLVRLHLMELGPGGADAQPTGRVVVFSNSVVFQSGGGFFRQIPGTNFVWHQITLTLAAESDYRSVEERLVGAVEKVFGEYRDKMEHQRKRMQHALSTVAVDSLRPQSRLRLTQSGLDVVIRYPLELEKAAEVDDRITREVMDAIERKPKLKLVGSGTPNIQPVQEPARAVGN